VRQVGQLPRITHCSFWKHLRPMKLEL